MSASRGRDGPVSSLCSRNARSRTPLVGRAQWETHPDHPWKKSTSKLGSAIVSCLLRPCLGQGASLGEEAVSADSGREGEITARVGRVRSPAILSILLIIRHYYLMYWTTSSRAKIELFRKL
jgi:hypothetical protein